MEHEISAITSWADGALRGLLGTPVNLPDQAVVAFFIVLGSLIILPAMSRRFSVDRPGVAQQMLEIGVESIHTMLDSFIGKNGRRYFPLMGAFAFFILVSNLLANIPGFQPPTANLNTTVALAVISFLYYNYQGIRANGVGWWQIGGLAIPYPVYFRQFLGDPLWLAPLMIPIEILSHLSRPLSLSVRLFGNIFGEHTLAAVFFLLVPLGLPIVFAPLGVFIAFMQTFVFVMLSMIYIAGAIEHGL